MRQDKLTLEGMQEGVRDSEVFLLVLSEHVLASWFCQQEMLTAIEARKPIQLILEEEDRFFPFKLDQPSRDATSGDVIWPSWKELQETPVGDSGDKATWRKVLNVFKKETPVPPQISQMIDENLDNAVTYRRRDFEVAAMMRELCVRNGLELPTRRSLSARGSGEVDKGQYFNLKRQLSHHGSTTQLAKTGSALNKRGSLRRMGSMSRTWTNQCTHTVFVICTKHMRTMDSGSDMFRDLTDTIEQFVGLRVTTAFREANRFLLLLSKGVLEPGSESLEQLHAAITIDDTDFMTENIVAVYERTSWYFGCDEQLSADEEVLRCLSNHEAMVFRPKDPVGTGPTKGRNRHEFSAMADNMLMKLMTCTGSCV